MDLALEKIKRIKRTGGISDSREHEINRLYHNGQVSISTLQAFYDLNESELRLLLRLDL